MTNNQEFIHSRVSYMFQFVGLALLDGFVYAVGGWEGTSRLDSVERYNPETNTWSSIPNLRMAVTSPAVITNEGKKGDQIGLSH